MKYENFGVVDPQKRRRILLPLFRWRPRKENTIPTQLLCYLDFKNLKCFFKESFNDIKKINHRWGH